MLKDLGVLQRQFNHFADAPDLVAQTTYVFISHRVGLFRSANAPDHGGRTENHRPDRIRGFDGEFARLSPDQHGAHPITNGHRNPVEQTGQRTGLGWPRPTANLFQVHPARARHGNGAKSHRFVDPGTGIDTHQPIHLNQRLLSLGGMGEHDTGRSGSFAGDGDDIAYLNTQLGNILGVEANQTATNVAGRRFANAKGW